MSWSTAGDGSLEHATPDPELDEFRREGHRLIDWIADYLAHPERHPVLAATEPGALTRELPTAAPSTGEPLSAIIDDFERQIPPHSTHWNHPGFLAYFASSGSPPGILAELASAALNVNAMLWRTAPAATELEQVVLGWLRDALGLPNDWFGILTDTASMSTLLALAAARDHALPQTRRRGLALPDARPLRMYTSDQAHSSVDKAAVALGVGLDNVVKIASDAEFRMDVAALATAVRDDRGAGFVPFAIVATAGTTSTTSVDPVRAIAAVARDQGLWLHVDAAYGGTAAIAPELRWVLDGAEHADSLVVNPHKWMFTPIDASALYTRRPDDLRRAFSHVAEYLTTDAEGVVDLMDYGLQLGRRFRALKLWFVLRSYGLDGLAERIRNHVRLAAELAARVDAHDDLELMAPSPLGVVCLRAHPAEVRDRLEGPASERALERLNRDVMARVNASGEVFLSHTVLRGRFVLRIAIGHLNTRETHVRRAETLLLDAARQATKALFLTEEPVEPSRREDHD